MARVFKPGPLPQGHCPRCGCYAVRKLAITWTAYEVVCRLCGRKIR